MKWVPRQFLLPILIGFSVTGVGAALVYYLCKKEDDNEKENITTVIQKRQKREIKVPKQHVPAVIGRGGTVIREIQNKTDTYIHFESDNIDSPDRTCVIKGTIEGIEAAESMIQNIVINRPIIETYETYVPQRICGKIIEKGRENIQHIQLQTGTKIIIDAKFVSQNPDAEQRVIIKGTAEQIAAALQQIEDFVREEKQERLKSEANGTTRLPRGKLSPRNTAVKSSETESQSAEVLSQQDVSGLMEVFVSAMENPSQFWIQLVGAGTTALDKLVNEMTTYYNDEENYELHTLNSISVGQMVAAKFSYDQRWYRGEVVSAPVDGICDVYFVDYGDHEKVETSCVLELRTDFLSLKLQAIECSLANVKSRDEEWSEEACDKFAELTSVAQWKVLVAKVRGYKERLIGCGKSRREGSPIPCVDLYDRNDEKEINVGKELINQGFAEASDEAWSAASSTLSLSKRSQDIHANMASSTPRIHSPSPELSIIDESRSKIVEEIDLTTPKKPIEQIDLVTPVAPVARVANESSKFIDTEKKILLEDGSGDHLRNGSYGEDYRRADTSKLKIHPTLRYAPAGYESDLSDASDEFELG